MQDDDLAAAMRALGHPVRLSILRILTVERPDCCCTDVTQSLPLAQSTVSQHLKVLLEAGLIRRHARGTRNCYSADMEKLAALGTAFDGLMDRFTASSRQSDRKEKTTETI